MMFEARKPSGAASACSVVWVVDCWLVVGWFSAVVVVVVCD
jgi:hypothetical protein